MKVADVAAFHPVNIFVSTYYVMFYYACRMWRKRFTIEHFICIEAVKIPLALATTILLLMSIKTKGFPSFLEVSLLL